MQTLSSVLGDSALGEIETVEIPGGRALMGTNFPVFPGDGEGPLREQTIDSFHITPTAITNRQFAAFIKETGYVTEAERFGWSFVFADALVRQKYAEAQVANMPWWHKVRSANWLNPKGPEETIANFERLPVVQVSYNDAAAFAMWAGGRLPTEAEWEHAARGGLDDVRYPWGNDEPSTDDPKCHFGQINMPEPDPQTIGPVAADSFQANAYGLYNMVGNVWEWTCSDADYSRGNALTQIPQKLLKGGSYLCHPNSCFRYRIAARIANTIDTSIAHTGFRIMFS